MEERIGKYEIQAELGKGGFGKVYRAYDPLMGRPVAIKVLTGDGNPELLARFRAEAGLTGKLQHKNIVTVYDSGEQNGAPYIVMELLDGENLEQLLADKRPLSLLERVQIMCQVAEGLHYAHSAGVIHRDVKPANIMLLPNGLVKIMDFGVARLVAGSAMRQTSAGDLIGTISYMSPEQFRKSEADVPTDVFAYGVISYELLCGVHPFPGEDVSDVIYRVMSVDPVPLREMAPDCPEALETLVHRALAKDRTRRYASMDEVLLDAEPILLDLRREQAAQVVADVTELMRQGEFTAAHSKLKLAFDLDPSNQDARRIRRTIDEERNRRVIDDGVKVLEREAAAKLIARQFADAVQKLEAALRLRPQDQRLQSLVLEAGTRMRANREAGRLLSEAKREAQSERLQQAKALAVQALQVDAEHPEIQPLIEHLDDSIERIERAGRLRAGLEAVEALLAANKPAEAMGELEPLDTAYPGSQQISELHARIRARQMEEYRRERSDRLTVGMEQARELRRNGDFAAAIAMLDSLIAEFPAISILDNLKTSTEEEIAAENRARDIEALLSNARELLWSAKLSDGVAMLQNAASRYSGDAGVDKLLQAGRALLAENERRASVSKITERARQLRKEGQIDEAAELIKNCIRQHGPDTVIGDLGRILNLESEDRRATERLAAYKRDAAQLLSSGAVGDALPLLREARTHFPAEPSLELLLSMAEESYAKQNEQDMVRSVLKASEDHKRGGDLAGASEEISKGLRRFPASKDLLEAASNLRELLHAAERGKKIAQTANEIREALARDDWNGARSLLNAAQREYPDQVAFDELAAQVAKKQRTAEADRALAEVRDHLERGNLESAESALAVLESAYGTEEPWKVENIRLGIRKRQFSELRSAEGLRRDEKYVEAEAILQRLHEELPADLQVSALLKTVQKEASAKSAANVPKPSRIRFDNAIPPLARIKIQKITCSSCGTLLPDRARFCDNCGTPVLTQAQGKAGPQ